MNRPIAGRRSDFSSPTDHQHQQDGAVAARQPWQPRQDGCHDVIWRDAGNPLIGRHHLPGVQGIYNSAVVPFGDRFAGVFRVEKRTRFPRLHVCLAYAHLDELIEFVKENSRVF